MSHDNRYPLTKMTVSKRNPTTDFPRKHDRPTKTVEVMAYPKPYGKQRKAVNRKAAEARAAISSLMSPQERITLLDRSFGVGQGAQRERARLARKIEALKNPPKVEKKTDNNRDARIEKQKRKEAHDKVKKA